MQPGEKVTWEQLKEGDQVFIGYLEYDGDGQPGITQRKGPHVVQSVQNHELKNGVGIGQMTWHGDLYRAVP